MIKPNEQLTHYGLTGIRGPLVFVRKTGSVALNHRVEVITGDGEKRLGRVVAIDLDQVVVETFKGTDGLALGKSGVRFLHEPIMLDVGKGMLGRVFDGVGQPLDGGPKITPEKRMRVDGASINPARREPPTEFIETGFSAIDALNSLVRGQKLPVFSGSGLDHNRLATHIARYARLPGQTEDNFAVVFGAIGVTYEVAEQFRREMEDYGALERIVLFLNLASDPSAERLLTPRMVLTAAEYLAYEEGRHVLVIMTDITNYCEALREVSASHGEIPSRKGYPGYMYSDLASLYERAGRIIGKQGSITQVPILTMPNDDLTHPIPDLSGYITEGQIVLDRELQRRNIFPPIKLLPSLSRLMSDGIGEGLTDPDHPSLAQQLYSIYAQANRIRLLSSIVGEEGLSEIDRKIMLCGQQMDTEFIQQQEERRDLSETMTIGWRLLSSLPDEALAQLSDEKIAKHLAPFRDA